MIEQVDAEIGQLLDVLEATGLDQNTFVIFTSDHGEGRGRHGLLTKNYLYEDAIKVPMIVSFRGRIAPGRTHSTHLVSGVDILPTICDHAEVKPPVTCGQSLRPLLETNSGSSRQAVFSEARLVGRAVRSKDYKYINFFGTDAVQLFDMRSDPWEMNNLAGDARYKAVLDKHLTLLRNWEAGLDPAPDIKVPWNVSQEQARTMVAHSVITLEGTVFENIQTTGGIWQSGNNPAQPQFSIDRRILPLSYTVSFTPQQNGTLKINMPIYQGPVTLTELHAEGVVDKPNTIAAMSVLPGKPWLFPGGAEWVSADDVHGIRLTTGQRLRCNNLGRVKKGILVTIRLTLV